MADPIDFYFDFSSPYGYLAAQEIDAFAEHHLRTVRWRPMLIGAAFKQTGSKPLLDLPMKGDYARHDIGRAARRIGVTFRLPNPFPFMSVAAARAFYWRADTNEAEAKELAKALYRAAFSEGSDISSAKSVAEVAHAACGIPVDQTLAALNEPQLKDRLRTIVTEAIDRGVFGSPFIFIDDEPFWGFDKIPDMERWLERGGW